MKLATLKDGSRDGQLVVVSRDLASAHFAADIAMRLQQVLDDWNFLSPQLEDLYAALNGGRARHAFAFEPQRCMAPLPRAYQWVDASACLLHQRRLRQALGVQAAHGEGAQLLMDQRGSDGLLGPCDDAPFADAEPGIDFEAQIAVVTGDVALGSTPDAALEGVRLLMLVNDWSQRQEPRVEPDPGARTGRSVPASAFGPVAVTPDELGTAWRGGRVHLALSSHCNGRPIGHCDTGAQMDFHFGQLIAEVAKARPVRAGSVIGGGVVSDEDPSRGASCIAEKRALEILEIGQAQTPFLRFDDIVRIETLDAQGHSLFGAIEQRVVRAGAAAPGEAH